MIGDEVEFIPEPVQRLLSLVVEDQFYQRGIVAPVSHHVMVAGAQKAPLVLGIVREKTSAFANIECVGENRAEAREGGLVASPFALRNHEIGIAGSGFQHQSRRANRRFLSEPGIFRDFGRHRRRIARHPQKRRLRVGQQQLVVSGVHELGDHLSHGVPAARTERLEQVAGLGRYTDRCRHSHVDDQYTRYGPRMSARPRCGYGTGKTHFSTRLLPGPSKVPLSSAYTLEP